MIAAQRYAKALLDLALEKKALDDLDRDVSALSAAFKSIRDLQLFIQSPVITSSKKIQIMSALFAQQTSALCLEFLKLVCRQRREALLPEIFTSYTQLRLQQQGIEKINLVSAVELDAATKSSIYKSVRAAWGASTVIEESVKSELIGGFIIRQGDRQWDHSVARQLQSIRKQLITKN